MKWRRDEGDGSSTRGKETLTHFRRRRIRKTRFNASNRWRAILRWRLTSSAFLYGGDPPIRTKTSSYGDAFLYERRLRGTGTRGLCTFDARGMSIECLPASNRNSGRARHFSVRPGALRWTVRQFAGNARRRCLRNNSDLWPGMNGQTGA